MSAPPPPRDAAECLYALLLCAYPAAFRERFGAEMRQLVRDRRRDAAERGEGPARFWLGLAADTARSLPAQHLAALRERRHASSPRAPVHRFQEKTMIFRRLVGALLAGGALLHIVMDATNDDASMGGLAILLTALMLAAGAVLLVYPRRAA